ncbi:OmpH family outer membrane protein [uncultured Dialister sp.]|jgi:outer membrane protein|uniref:OmpH family outer membrane protein n=1 Tax=uncultured Dialister sp. TaxID=278064 RepID=UPI0025EC8E3F|nr:OmpH family outer membrane protein [uncultured Dialister sp.]
MEKAAWKKLACVGMIALAAVFSGCGSEHKVAVVDYQKLEDQSPKIKAIQQEITDKDKEISNRLAEAQKSGLSDDEMQKKVQSAQQERMIFIQSKQKQIESMVQSQAGAIAKEKNIGIVMNKMAVPTGAVDITDEVLAKMDGGASKAAASQSK